MEHIVISSAGPNGLIQLGMLAALMEANYFSLDTIQSIHGTSAGSMLAVLLCLKVPIQDAVDYFIKRPLHKWFKVDVTQFMQTNGIATCTLAELVTPLFHAQDIPLTITMKELYERSGIHLHIFSTRITKVECIDIDHVEFPDLPVIQAISMSCAIPLLFPPVEYNGEFYIDGGLFMHCPVAPNEKTIVLDIKNTSTLSMESPFIMFNHIFLQATKRLSPVITIGKLFQYGTDAHGLAPTLWESMLKEETFRAELIQRGKDHAIKLMET
jgi:predicted acylesterase/phospholipase RssA